MRMALVVVSSLAFNFPFYLPMKHSNELAIPVWSAHALTIHRPSLISRFNKGEN